MSNPQAIRKGTAQHPASDAEIGLLNIDDRLQEEMRRLAAINQELLSSSGSDAKKAFNLPDDELTLLRAENAELRARVEELEQVLQASPPGEEATESWSERQKEYEALLDEKSEVIRSLHLKIQEFQEGGRTSDSAADSGTVERLKKELEEQRSQLMEDEDSLMQQMRQMEMAMSKDRAELARQRNEVQRLHNELNHEIEIASRDPGLRERLVALQRLQGEIGRKQSPTPPLPTKNPVETTSATPTTPLPSKKKSGLLRRIFG